MPPEKVKNFGKGRGLGRAGQPVELAPVFVLLASDDSSDRRQAAHLTGSGDSVPASQRGATMQHKHCSSARASVSCWATNTPRALTPACAAWLWIAW